MTIMDVSFLRDRIEKYVAAGEWTDAIFWSEKLLSLTQGRPIDLIYYIRGLIETEQFHRALSCLKRVSSVDVSMFGNDHASTSVDDDPPNRHVSVQADYNFRLNINDDERFNINPVDDDLFRKHKLLKYLAARCLIGTKKYDEAIKLATLALNSDNIVMNSTSLPAVSISHTTSACPSNNEDFFDTLVREWKVDASLYLLLGSAYENVDNRTQARMAYEKCLKCDVYRFEALRRLDERHLLTETQKLQLLDDLPILEQCSNEEAQLLRFIYEAMIKKESMTADNKFPSSVSSALPTHKADRDVEDKQSHSLLEAKRFLSHNPSLLAAESKRHYFKGDYRRAYDLTSKILKREQFRFDCLPVHICCLVKLDNINELFKLAHKLVDIYPENAVSWFAVACYYWCSGQMDAAKRFFDKCTLLEPQSGECWIGYGHAFAAEQEHDQAMNCYVKAAKLMTSSYIPLLYVGLEYASTNNLKLAAKFLHEALTMAPDDPHTLHEMGVLLYRQENYVEAEHHFRLAINAVMKIEESKSTGNSHTAPNLSWEPLLNNMGHTLRKLKRYDEALEWHTRALRLLPRDASTLASLGYCNMFLENFDAAVDYFHQSLSIRRDDTFVAGVLSKCMEIMSDSPFARVTIGEEPTDSPKLVGLLPGDSTITTIKPRKISNEKGGSTTSGRGRKCTPRRTCSGGGSSMMTRTRSGDNVQSITTINNSTNSRDESPSWTNNIDDNQSILDIDMEM